MLTVLASIALIVGSIQTAHMLSEANPSGDEASKPMVVVMQAEQGAEPALRPSAE